MQINRKLVIFVYYSQIQNFDKKRLFYTHIDEHPVENSVETVQNLNFTSFFCELLFVACVKLYKKPCQELF